MGFDDTFDPLDELNDKASGVAIDLGGGDQVVLLGVVSTELSETNFFIA